jgi:hypothetical protein
MLRQHEPWALYRYANLNVDHNEKLQACRLTFRSAGDLGTGRSTGSHASITLRHCPESVLLPSPPPPLFPRIFEPEVPESGGHQPGILGTYFDIER